jgi:hypothetical protein
MWPFRNKYLADEEPWKMIKLMKAACKHKCMWRQIAAALSSLANHSCLYRQEIIQNFRKSVELGYHFRNSDLICRTPNI